MNNTMTGQNTFDIYDEGIRLLTEHMGVLKTETFISVVLREQFDYTKWHRTLADNTTKEQFHEWAQENERINPYKGDPSTIL